MRWTYILIFLLIISSVQAIYIPRVMTWERRCMRGEACGVNSSVYSPTEISGNLGSRYYSLQHHYRYGECEWIRGKGTVCYTNGEELPYHQERLIETSQGPVKVRDLATSVTPWWKAPRGSTPMPTYITNRELN